MNAFVLRLAVFVAAVLAASIAASVTAYNHLTGANAELKTDSIIFGKFEVLKTAEVDVGPIKKTPAAYNITLPNGESVEVAYLPAGSEVYIEDGWIIGFYRLKP